MINLEAIADRLTRDAGFDPQFGDEVNREVAAMSKQLPLGLLDLRKLPWASIGVAIADVDALVHKNSAIDRRAARNTNTVYTGIAIFPMLPKALSTGLTSLNEDAGRAAIVTEMVVAKDGSITAQAPKAPTLASSPLSPRAASSATSAASMWATK